MKDEDSEGIWDLLEYVSDVDGLTDYVVVGLAHL